MLKLVHCNPELTSHGEKHTLMSAAKYTPRVLKKNMVQAFSAAAKSFQWKWRKVERKQH